MEKESEHERSARDSGPRSARRPGVRKCTRRIRAGRRKTERRTKRSRESGRGAPRDAILMSAAANGKRGSTLFDGEAVAGQLPSTAPRRQGGHAVALRSHAVAATGGTKNSRGLRRLSGAHAISARWGCRTAGSTRPQAASRASGGSARIQPAASQPRSR